MADEIYATAVGIVETLREQIQVPAPDWPAIYGRAQHLADIAKALSPVVGEPLEPLSVPPMSEDELDGRFDEIIGRVTLELGERIEADFSEADAAAIRTAFLKVARGIRRLTGLVTFERVQAARRSLIEEVRREHRVDVSYLHAELSYVDGQGVESDPDEWAEKFGPRGEED